MIVVPITAYTFVQKKKKKKAEQDLKVDRMPDWSALPIAKLDLQCKCSVLWFDVSPLIYAGSEKKLLKRKLHMS